MTLHNASGVGTNADRFLTGSEAQAAALAAGGAVTSISFRTGVFQVHPSAAGALLLLGSCNWRSRGGNPWCTPIHSSNRLARSLEA